MAEEDQSGAATFGSELRRLRRAEGKSLAGLAEEMRTSKGYLSRLENGLQKPGEQFARACDQVLKADGWLVALAVSERAARCPYPGLTSFRTQEADWFFGRDRALADVLGLVADAAVAGRPAAVIGPSGIGKSSLLGAGLAHAVLRGALPGHRPGAKDVLCLTPTAQPMNELRDHDMRRPLASYALVIVDQFEEVFTLCKDVAERDTYIAELCCRSAAALPVVLGLRADFYGHCLAHPPLQAARSHALPLGPMTVAELREAITAPATAEGLTLEPGLVEVLLRDMGAMPGADTCSAGALPLLARALRATWQQRTDGVLTVAGYERTGGIYGAVATTAERLYARLNPQEQNTGARSCSAWSASATATASMRSVSRPTGTPCSRQTPRRRGSWRRSPGHGC
nr:XRE family transcriptional regulator [Streptomyces torulosus]